MNRLVSMLAPLAGAADDIREIRGPILAPEQPAWWPYAVVALAAIVLALGVRWLIHRRGAPLSPQAEALRTLEAARPLIDRSDPNGFSQLVSDAVRNYVERAFAVHAPRRTTEELLAQLMTDASPVAAHRAELGRFLEFCDLAKYARWSLTRDDMTGMVASAETFVRATASPQEGPT
jgi:hypothetical protein